MGDVYIPNRIDQIPEEIKKVLMDNKTKITRIICTGNFGNMETYDWFNSLLSKGREYNFHCVRNHFQEAKVSFPETTCIKSNEFKIRIINGYQVVPWGDLTALSSILKKLECDILVSGFTHVKGVYQFEGKWYINPGTITGAFSPLNNNPVPSFMILLTMEDTAILYSYELNQSTKVLDVSKVEISKS